MVQPNYTTNFQEKVAVEEEAEPERTNCGPPPPLALEGPWKDPGRTCSPAAAQGRLALGKQSRCLGASFVLLMGVFLLLAPRGELANEPPTRALPPATPVAPPEEDGSHTPSDTDGQLCSSDYVPAFKY